MPTIQYKNLSNEPVTAEVISIAGEVLEISRSNQTHLHASGGGASVSSNTAYGGYTTVTARASPVSVSSSTSVHDDVHILTESGEEVFLQLVNWESAGIRKGHQIQVLWLDAVLNHDKKLATPYVVVNNRSLNRVLYDDEGISETLRATSPLKLAIASFTKAGMGLKIGFIASLVMFFPIAIVPFKVMLGNLTPKRVEMLNRDVKPQLAKFVLPPMNKR